MTQAREILKLIEEADPSDTAKLDEIDARVLCYLENRFVEHGCEPWIFKRMAPEIMTKDERKWFIFNTDSVSQNSTKYTRSRDALKHIRPKGWVFRLNIGDEWAAYSIKNVKDHSILATALPTEELAELHAIIQALDHERSQP